MADTIRFCPKCKLAYRPDDRTHDRPEEFCPRCGYDLSKDADWKKENPPIAERTWYL